MMRRRPTLPLINGQQSGKLSMPPTTRPPISRHPQTAKTKTEETNPRKVTPSNPISRLESTLYTSIGRSIPQKHVPFLGLESYPNIDFSPRFRLLLTCSSLFLQDP